MINDVNWTTCFRLLRGPSSGSTSYRIPYISWILSDRYWDLIIYFFIYFTAIYGEKIDEISISISLNPWNILSPIACWTWWWPLSRPKHVVQLTSFITDQLVVFWLPYTSFCVTHTMGMPQLKSTFQVAYPQTLPRSSPFSVLTSSRGSFFELSWKAFFTGVSR